MTSSSRRTTTGLAVLCAFFAVMLLGVGAAGILGVRHDNAVVRDFTADELATSATTALVDRTIDQAYSAGSAVVTAAPQRRAALASTLYDERIPAVEAAVEKLRALHSGDAADERAGIAVFVDKWHRLRAVLNALAGPRPHRAGIGRGHRPEPSPRAGLRAADRAARGPVRPRGPRRPRRPDRRHRRQPLHRSGPSCCPCWRRCWPSQCSPRSCSGAYAERSNRPQDQVEFADTLQLAENEEEAHQLLQRHLERAVAGGTSPCSTATTAPTGSKR